MYFFSIEFDEKYPMSVIVFIRKFSNFIFSTIFHLSRDYYFTSAQWVSLTEVCVVWLTRVQNLTVVSVCKSPMWYCQEVGYDTIWLLFLFIFLLFPFLCFFI